MKKRPVTVTGRFYHRQNTFRNNTNLLHFYIYALHHAAQHPIAMFKIIIAEFRPVLGFGVGK